MVRGPSMLGFTGTTRATGTRGTRVAPPAGPLEDELLKREVGVLRRTSSSLKDGGGNAAWAEDARWWEYGRL